MRPASRIFYFTAYVAFRACEALVRILPIEVAFGIGKVAGDVAYFALRKRRAIATANLRLAFGGTMSEAQIRTTNREHFRLLGANLMAGLKASTMQNERIWKRVAANVPDERLRSGWIALISHIGNWELFSHLGERFPEYRFGAIYQSLANPYIDRYLRETRMRSGLTLFDRRTEMLRCVRFLRAGGVVGVLVDQGAGYAGLWTPLFGRLTSSSTLPATLSIRTKLPVVPIAIYTAGHARWDMAISEPVFPSEEENAENFTAQINRLLEEQIRRSPADWLWSHNRWKPLRPHLLFARDQRRVFLPAQANGRTVDAFRILIVAPTSDAEAEAAVPAIRAIKGGRPDTWLAILAADDSAQFWRDQPDADHVIEVPESASAISISRNIRQVAQFDAAVFLAPRWKTAVAARLAGIPIRVGMRRGLISRLFNQHPQQPPQPLSPTAYFLHIAHSIGADINRAEP